MVAIYAKKVEFSNELNVREYKISDYEKLTKRNAYQENLVNTSINRKLQASEKSFIEKFKNDELKQEDLDKQSKLYNSSEETKARNNWQRVQEDIKATSLYDEKKEKPLYTELVKPLKQPKKSLNEHDNKESETISAEQWEKFTSMVRSGGKEINF